MSKTQITNEQLTQGKYKTPIQKTKELISKQAEERQEKAHLREDLERQIRQEMPKASQEKVDALIYRMTWEAKNIREEPHDPELTLKPNTTKTNKPTKLKEYYHTGVWEKSKFEPDGAFAWSCCQNGDEDDEGCQVRLVDPNRLNVVSF